MLFSILAGLFSNDLAIDLGTANTLVFVRGEGIVMNEPSIVAIHQADHSVLAVGHEAKAMLGRTPGNIVAIRPLKDGVIADFDVTEKMLHYFISKVHRRRTLVHPRIVIGVPSGITQVEKRAVRDSAMQAGAREVYLIEEPMAAAIGAGLPIQEPGGNMIVDMGGGHHRGRGDLAVRHRVLASRCASPATRWTRRSSSTSRSTTTSWSASGAPRRSRSSSAPRTRWAASASRMEVKGRDLIDGIPKTIVVTDEEIREALREPVISIVDTVRTCLERSPPELAADIVDKGIVLTGGGALLRGLDCSSARRPTCPSRWRRPAVLRGAGCRQGPGRDGSAEEGRDPGLSLVLVTGRAGGSPLGIAVRIRARVAGGGRGLPGAPHRADAWAGRGAPGDLAVPRHHARAESSSSSSTVRALGLERVRRLAVRAPRERAPARRQRAAARRGLQVQETQRENGRLRRLLALRQRLPLAHAARRDHRPRGRRLGAIGHREPRARRRGGPADAGDRRPKGWWAGSSACGPGTLCAAPERSRLDGGRAGPAHAHGGAGGGRSRRHPPVQVHGARRGEHRGRRSARDLGGGRAYSRGACRRAVRLASRTRDPRCSTSPCWCPSCDFARLEEVLLVTGAVDPGPRRAVPRRGGMARLTCGRHALAALSHPGRQPRAVERDAHPGLRGSACRTCPWCWRFWSRCAGARKGAASPGSWPACFRI